MQTLTLAPEDKKLMQDFNRNIQWLKQKETKKKETWVSVGFISTLTGWDSNKLRQARNQGLVQFRNANGKFEYLVESLSDKFIIKTID